MQFSYRRYQDGDATAINELYFRITGRRRTIDQHAWQWLQSPAGESEMWLIEAEKEGGIKELIGHHGVMAEAFTYYGKPARVGKTENTMVLPEYREKILYPRYEKIFLKEYENEFHALFSTTGPAPAIRLRKSMGYVFEHEWINIYIGSEPFSSLNLIKERYLNREDNISLQLSRLGSRCVNGTEIACIDDELESFDFDGFWAIASKKYSLTPARTRANLNWRFWSNPYNTYHTIKLVNPKHGFCIAIITIKSGYLLRLEDFYCEDPNNLAYFLDVLRKWCKSFLRIQTIVISSTTDNLDFFGSHQNRQSLWIHNLIKRGLSMNREKMPRKITKNGDLLGINKDDNWFVTPFYFEGRS